MKTVFFSIASDNYYNSTHTNEFINSFKKFHPDIDLKIFRQKEIEAVFATNPGINFQNCKGAFAKTLYNDYELVVMIDIDHIVFDRLTEILEGDYDVAAPANFNRWINTGISVRTFSGWGEGEYVVVPQEKYLQAGVVASPKKEFWDLYYYMSLNHWSHLLQRENDVLNLMAYLLPFKTRVLDGDTRYDSPNFKNYYGCASLGAESNFVVEGNKVMLDGRQVKLYHYARGSVKPHPKDLFSPSVCDFIASISRDSGKII